MPSHVLVGLSGPAQAASDAKPPKDVKDGPAKGSRRLGVRRLLKLVFLAITVSAVGLTVWFFQPVPVIMGLVHTVKSKASTLSVPGISSSDTPQEQAQAEATSSAPTSPTPNADESTSSIPDVHPPTVEAAARLARLQARSRPASGLVASAGAPAARATTAPATATTALPSETKAATIAADSSDGATVSASTSAATSAAADPPPDQAPTPARQATPGPSRTAPVARSRTGPAAGSPLYSQTDADVAPPRPILQQKLGGIVGAIDPRAEVTIEFVVDELGYVESAKAKSVPRSVGESVLMATGLHAIKSWRFQPAEKNGQPVRYRNSISFGAY